MFKLKDKIIVQHRNQNIIGTLIGIDTYTLENFAGKKIVWTSYTLVSNKAGKFKRFWFVSWGKSEWILWLKATKDSIPNALPALQKSGIAKIIFSGDAGPSTPIAALVQYKNKDKYFCIERFSNSKTMYFSGYRIPKPRHTK